MIGYVFLFLGIFSFSIYYFLKNSKNKKLEILKNDPFLPYRILRDNFKYYYTSKDSPKGISELRVVGKFYELDYTYGGVNYTKRFHKKFEPSTLSITKIYTVNEGKETEVTSKLQPYLGVNKDFHSATPAMLGYENLHFLTEDIMEETNNIITVEKNSIIRL